MKALLAMMDLAGAGRSATAIRSGTGTRAASCCSATPRIRRCNRWRRAPAWRSRTGFASPNCIATPSGDYEAAFRRYESARVSAHRARARSSRAIIWDVYHADGIEREVYAQMLGERSEDDMFHCLAWLYDGFRCRRARRCSTARNLDSIGASESARAERARMSKHVAVLMGGWSAEREVSLRSGKACADALERAGLSASPASMSAATSPPCSTTLKPDVALNVLHGRPGEDGTLQGILEILGIPYTPFRRLASALAMQKDVAKVVMARRRRAGAGRQVVVALRGRQGAPAAAALCDQADRGRLERRRVHRHRAARPSAAGAVPRRLGLRRAGAGRALHPRQGTDLRRDGRQGARTSSRSCRRRGSTTTRRNMRPAAPNIVLPAPISPFVYQEVRRLALKAHRALGCRGVSRADFRYDDRSRGDGGAGLSRSQHAARHDRDFARARARGACGHDVR